MSPSGTIHSPITRAMVHYVSSKGVDREELCQLAQIPRSVLENPEEKFSFKVMTLFLRKGSAFLFVDANRGHFYSEFFDIKS